MKPAKIVALIWGLFISTPLWLFIVYNLILASHPDRLMWFLFYAYVPASFMGTIIGSIAFKDDK